MPELDRITKPKGKPWAVIVGGGLAGMTAAKVLVEHGVHVTLIEAADHLGGKAGSRQINGSLEDHGFHVFPAWYANTRKVMRDVKCFDNLVDLFQFHYLRKGAYPHFDTAYDFNSIENLLHNLLRGPLPWYDNVLSYYAVLELAAEPHGTRRYLDRVNGSGYLWSRIYANQNIVDFHHQNVLQAAAVPFYECSAMTLRKMFRMWIRQPTPLYSLLKGPLQTKFIEPFREYLEKKGVDIRLNQGVRNLMMARGRVSNLNADIEGGAYILENWSHAAHYILAVPHAQATQMTDQVTLQEEWKAARSRGTRGLRQEPSGLVGLANLRSAPMAAWHVPLKRKVKALPREHFNLLGSRFGLTVADISEHWGLKDTSVLNVVASNFHPLRYLATDERTAKTGEDQQKQFLREELMEYITELRKEDFPEGDGYLQSHTDEQLFLNTAGAWEFRPEAKTGIPNLFLAGDYCRTPADLATMESAVMSGIQAALAVLEAAGIEAKTSVEVPPEVPTALMQVAKYATLPLVAPLILRQWAINTLEDWGIWSS